MQKEKNNKIKNAYHQFSKYLVKNFDIIAMEDLNIKEMFQNKKWAPKLQRIALYKLITMIKYKSNWNNKKFIQIDRFYPSSQLCHVCGYQNKQLTLKNRQWKCPKCGTNHQRDINAAKNILQHALT